jgi:predicted flap endonuclease-1-like 5' DNA nuclease
VLANLTVLFLAGLLAITICLLPLALVPLLLLLAVNVVGWAVASQIVGERIVAATKQTVQPALTVLVGAFFLTGTSALLWAMGGCFQFVASLLIFAVSSVGAGAVLVPWLNRRRGFGGWTGHGGRVPPTEPTPPSPAPSRGVAEDQDVAAPLGYTTAAEVNAANRGAGATAVMTPSAATSEATTAEALTAETVEQDVAAPLDYVTAEEINATQEQSSTSATKSRGRGSKKAATSTSTATPASEGAAEEIVEQDVAGPIDYVTAQEVITTEAVTEGDDFLRIKGVGPTYARRLKDAGYASFAQIAAATPEQVAVAIGWPVDRVLRSEIIDQAKVLAQR